MENNKVKVAVIQELKLTPKSKNPCIQNYTTVRKERPHGLGGGLLIFIHRCTGLQVFQCACNHYQRIDTPSKLLRRRLHSFPRPSDDDDRYPNTGRLQCTTLGMVLKLDRYERHPIGEYDI